MIKLFRNIRKSLLVGNNITKYLLYAIGEIVLVVIGILIALQINNNNIKNQTSKIEQEYLLALNEEFEVNLAKINKSILGAEQLNTSLNSALAYFDLPNLDTVSDIKVAKRMYEISGGHFDRFEPVNAVLSDIINSGKIGILQSHNLRQSIASFNSDIELLKKQLETTNSSQQEIQEFIKENGSIRGILQLLSSGNIKNSAHYKIDNKDIFRSVKFENYILDFLLSNRVVSKEYYPKIKTSIEEMLNEIRQSIKQ